MNPSGGTFEIVGRVDAYAVYTSKAGNKYGKGCAVDGDGRRFDFVVFDEGTIGAISTGDGCTLRGELRPRRTPGGMMVLDLVVKSVSYGGADDSEEDPFA